MGDFVHILKGSEWARSYTIKGEGTHIRVTIKEVDPVSQVEGVTLFEEYWTPDVAHEFAKRLEKEAGKVERHWR